ncbi:MAG: hypothetical protein U0736_19640 [Gemmataceae bacterium]
MMPQAGGQYVFLREAYSPLWGFLYGWTVFLVIQTGSIAAVGVAFAKFLGVLVPRWAPATRGCCCHSFAEPMRLLAAVRCRSRSRCWNARSSPSPPGSWWR